MLYISDFSYMTEGGQKSAFFPPRMAWKKRFSPSVREERGEILLHSPTLNLQVNPDIHFISMNLKMD